MSDFLNHIRYRQAQAQRLDALLAMPKEEAEAFFDRMDAIFARCDELKWASAHGIYPLSHEDMVAMTPQRCDCGKIFVNTDFTVCTACRNEEQAVAYKALRSEKIPPLTMDDVDF